MRMRCKIYTLLLTAFLLAGLLPVTALAESSSEIQIEYKYDSGVTEGLGIVVDMEYSVDEALISLTEAATEDDSYHVCVCTDGQGNIYELTRHGYFTYVDKSLIGTDPLTVYFHRHVGEWVVYHEGHVLKCAVAGCPSSEGLPWGTHYNEDADDRCDVCGYDMYGSQRRICPDPEELEFEMVGEGEPVPEAQLITFTNSGSEAVPILGWMLLQEGEAVSDEDCYFEVKLLEQKQELGPGESVTFSVRPKAWIFSESAEDQERFETDIILEYDFSHWTGQSIIRITAGGEADDDSGENTGASGESAGDVSALAKCDHSYIWNTWYDATSVSDGKMAYQCRHCGDVAEVVNLSAYARFLQETTEAVNKAPANAVVDIDAKMWMSISNSVAAAMRENSDVTMNIQFRYDGHLFQITIPAGYDLSSKMNEEGYAGFLYLAQDPALKLGMIR